VAGECKQCKTYKEKLDALGQELAEMFERACSCGALRSCPVKEAMIVKLMQFFGVGQDATRK
jgi:hypothetical protein